MNHDTIFNVVESTHYTYVYPLTHTVYTFGYLVNRILCSVFIGIAVPFILILGGLI